MGSMMLARSSTSSLSPHGALLRNRSLRTPSSDRLTNLKRGSIRGIQSILTPQGGYNPYGSGGIVDGRASPAPSFATSHEVVSRVFRHRAMTSDSQHFTGRECFERLVYDTRAWFRFQFVQHDHTGSAGRRRA